MNKVSSSELLRLIDHAKKIHGKDVLLYCETYPNFETLRLDLNLSEATISQSLGAYEHSLGFCDLRNAIASREKIKLGLGSIIAENVVVTHGATHAIFIVLAAEASPLTRLFLPNPSYSGYRDIAELLRIPLQPYSLPHFRDWDVYDVLDSLRPHDILIINSPHNPSGSILRHDQLSKIMRQQQSVGFSILFDFVYDEYCYEILNSNFGKCGFRSTPNRTYMVNSFSKNYGAPGLRIGWVTANLEEVKALEAQVEASVNTISTLNQKIALGILSNVKRVQSVEIKKRRDYLVSKLRAISGISFSVPEGGTILLLFFKTIDASQFARQLLKKHKILLLSGSAYFGDVGNCLRLSFGYNIQQIDEYINAISQEL